MKKIILLFAVSIMLMACSSDEDSSNCPEITKKNYVGGKPFFYLDNGQITQVSSNDYQSHNIGDNWCD